MIDERVAHERLLDHGVEPLRREAFEVVAPRLPEEARRDVGADLGELLLRDQALEDDVPVPLERLHRAVEELLRYLLLRSGGRAERAGEIHASVFEDIVEDTLRHGRPSVARCTLQTVKF